MARGRDTIVRQTIIDLNKANDKIINQSAQTYSKTKLKEKQTFKFRDQPKAKKKKSTDDFREYRNTITALLATYQWEAWQSGIEKSQSEIRSHLRESDISRKYIAELSKTTVPITKLNEFRNRHFKVGSLSDRVWDIQDIAKENIEMALTDALKTGKSPQQLARDIKRYLKNPYALYKRVRVEKGTIVPLRKMRVYKPGQGVYKSAHKNALRLAINEMRLAYETSRQIFMQNNPLIVGQEIRTISENSVCDICSHLAGRYPISFEWYLWHINCRCKRSFIIKSADEIVNEIRTGKTLKKEDSINFIKDMPDNFYKWKNEHGMKLKTKPYFLK